jgi:ribonuclease D
MTVSQPLPVEIVSQTAQLDAAVKEMLGSRDIALDTESNSFYRYPEQLCLVQIATRQKVYIIDTIVLKEIASLEEVLDASFVKIIHGADYDIRSLDRHCGFHIRNLYDTNIAARFAGLTQVGLAALLENLLGVTIPKSKRLQRADWGRRPLSAEALEYAATDVHHLMALQEILDQRLRILGRQTWVAEECARLEEVRYTAPDLEAAYLNIKGSKDLDGRELAVLQSLVQFRELEAQHQHRPPFFVLPDATLVYLATNYQADLSEVPGLGPTGLQRFGPGLRQALHNGIAAAPINRPPRARFVRPTAKEAKRLSDLKEWRTSLGSSLSLDPSLIWPLASLERLAKAPDSLNVELASDCVRHWQRDVFAVSLRACLNQ